MKEHDASRYIDATPLHDDIERAYFALHRNRYIDTLKLIPGRAIHGVRVADLGALPCHLSLALLKAGAREAVGLDYAPNRFGAQDRIERAGVRLYECDLEHERMPLEDGSVDIALCTEVIEHFEKGTAFFLGEARRILAPGGFLVLTTPNYGNLANRIRRVFGRPTYTAEEGRSGKAVHHHEYRMGELAAVLEAAGFAVGSRHFLAGSEKALVAGTFPTRLPRLLALAYAAMPLCIPPLRSYLCVIARPR